MRLLPRLFGLLLLGSLAVLLLFSASSCETTRTRENSDPVRDAQRISNADAELKGESASRMIVHFTNDGGMSFKTPRSSLAAAFIRQFDDGTTIDHINVSKAPGSDQKDPVYYLVGSGYLGGNYRAMAVPLRGTDDSTFYLSPDADRYVLTGKGCPTCYFDFENGYITGTTCDDNSGGSTCTLKVMPANNLFLRRAATK